MSTSDTVGRFWCFIFLTLCQLVTQWDGSGEAPGRFWCVIFGVMSTSEARGRSSGALFLTLCQPTERWDGSSAECLQQGNKFADLKAAGFPISPKIAVSPVEKAVQATAIFSNSLKSLFQCYRITSIAGRNQDFKIVENRSYLGQNDAPEPSETTEKVRIIKPGGSA